MTQQHRGARLADVIAIFNGRAELPDIGQFSDGEKRRLIWAVKCGFVRAERRPWPGPILETCIATWYVRIGC